MHIFQKTIVILSLVIFASTGAMAQSFGLKDSIEIMVKLDGSKCLTHTVEAKQTLYSISRLYNLPVAEILAYNNLTPKDYIYQGNKLFIPLRHKIYNRKDQITGYKTINRDNIYPIIYTVKPKDNLYAISKRYFKISTDDIHHNNKLPTNTIEIGQHLIIGWISLANDYSEWREKRNRQNTNKTSTIPTLPIEIETHKDVIVLDTKPTTTKPTVVDINKPIDEQSKIDDNTKTNIENKITKQKEKTSDEEISTGIAHSLDTMTAEVLAPKKNFINQTGIALWSKHNSDKTNSFVLHPTAKNNSIIELYNPLTNRTAFAKVIGHLQANIYEADVSIFISPKVAERLGALDERFKIQMIYYE